MMTFEEVFPSLKKKTVNISFDIEHFDGRWETEEHYYRGFIREKDVEKYCIDKSKLREMILDEELFPIYDINYRNHLIKKLNLEVTE